MANLEKIRAEIERNKWKPIEKAPHETLRATDKHQATIDAIKKSAIDAYHMYPVGILPPEFVLSEWENFQRLYGRERPECPTGGAGERGRNGKA